MRYKIFVFRVGSLRFADLFVALIERKNNDTGDVNEEEAFDVALEEASKENRNERPSAGKRQKKNEKFGFGGKKRFAKSGDALSTGDLRGFSVGGMKGRGKGKAPMKGKTQRLGKSRRNK